MSRLFGTDGVRGIANLELTPELAFQLGRCGAFVLAGETLHKPKILVGSDTRISCAMLESALVAGICSAGADALVCGVIPTPGIAKLVKTYKCDAGVVISASHNSFEYNGIKFFNGDGFKLPDSTEDKIEDMIRLDAKSNEKDKNKDKGRDKSINKDKNNENSQNIASDKEDLETETTTNDAQIITKRPMGENVGHRYFCETASEDYLESLKSAIKLDLSGLKIALDCAHGATYAIAQALFESYGANVVVIGNSPDGININKGCGSTHLGKLKELVVKEKCDLGFAFDGDGDRMLAVDAKGETVDGDVIMALIAQDMKNNNELNDDTLVVTVMSNLGLDIFASENGIKLKKTKVGDRYVLEEMAANGYMLGGEQSGHVILLEHSTTGDGMLSALSLLKAVKSQNMPLHEMRKVMNVLPQVLKGAKVKNELKHLALNDEELISTSNEMELMLAGRGRILIRASGTEPLIRVMIEGEDYDMISQMCQTLIDIINKKFVE